MKLYIYTITLLLFVACSPSNEGRLNLSSLTNNKSDSSTNSKSSSTNCDQTITKEFSTGKTMTICYDYKYKSAKYVTYTLYGNLVNKENISKRPSFYSDTSLPLDYRISSNDYIRSGYDRGHLAPDASFDYNSGDLKLIYTMANIIPQDHTVNSQFWIKVEKYARDKAVAFGEISIKNIVVFDSNPKYIKSKIAIAKGYYKILTNISKGFNECYYYLNYQDIVKASEDTLSRHKVSCSGL